MPQYFQVLRCYKCFVFQVHQVKKSNKFECKLCGEKQSIKRHYFVGTGKECRLHVQRLNGIRGDIDELKNALSSDDESEEIENIIKNYSQQSGNIKKESKWAGYIDKPEVSAENASDTSNDMFLENKEVVLELPAKRKKFTSKYKSYKNRGSFKNRKDQQLSPKESEEESEESEEVTNYNSINTPDSSMKVDSVMQTSKKPIPKKFVPPICAKQSKWAQFSDETEKSSEDQEQNTKIEYSVHNTNSNIKPIAFKENKNYSQMNGTNNQIYSKWDFREDTDKTQFKPNKIVPQFNVPVSSSSLKNRTQLFSLCNDNDLDVILDF